MCRGRRGAPGRSGRWRGSGGAPATPTWCAAAGTPRPAATSWELLEHGLAGSIGTVGDALDNALCESTIGLFKTEVIRRDGPAWKDRRDVEWQVARWVHWYNTTRLYSSIGHLPPIEYEHLHRQGTIVTTTAEVA